MIKHIVDSRFYTEAFNAAIFDGPMKIYFHQSREQTSLELYHRISQGDFFDWDLVKKLNAPLPKSLYVMVYNSEPGFREAFAEKGLHFGIQLIGESSFVIGVCESELLEKPNCLGPFLKGVFEGWSHNRPSLPQ